MHRFFASLTRTAHSLGLVAVGVLSTLGALSLAHVGPVHAQGGGDRLGDLERRLHADEAIIAALQKKTAPLSVSGQDLTISGVNVHIVSGSGSTYDGLWDASGNPVTGKSLTGLGNLIIGYNAEGNLKGDFRTGSHNLIIGDKNSYSSFGGFVAGNNNTASGQYASVCGGESNMAIGASTSVSGGSFNSATAHYASVSGGNDNRASGNSASITGGYGNTASSTDDSISGGDSNQASGNNTSIIGGYGNTASGEDASINGGYLNTVSGDFASVSGGKNLLLKTKFGWSGGSFHSP